MFKKTLLAQKTSAIVIFNDEASVVQLNDFAHDMPSERQFKDSGAMIAPCTIARTGIMQYRASECGALFADRDPNSIVKVATLEQDLFCKDSIESYRSAPITVDHPQEWVNTTNAKELQKGNLDSVPFADGHILSGHIVINDADTLTLVNDGKSQLSSGHSCTLVLADAGLEYDAYKTEIRANHIAIVESGRAGSAKIADAELKLSDAETKLKDAELKLVDTETKLADATKELSESKAKLEIAEEKIVVRDAEIAEVKTNLSDGAIDALVTKRMTFLDDVATISDLDITGMSTVEAKRAVVTELVDRDISGEDDTYINVRFQIALEDGGNDSAMTNLLRKQVNVEIKDGTETYVSPTEIARAKSVARNAHKNKGNK